MARNDGDGIDASDATLLPDFRASTECPFRLRLLWLILVGPGQENGWEICSVAIGSLPLFVGLAVVLPVLAHSTWHLYRKLVEPDLSPRLDRRPQAKGRRQDGDGCADDEASVDNT
jgi:hypothetical protein